MYQGQSPLPQARVEPVQVHGGQDQQTLIVDHPAQMPQRCERIVQVLEDVQHDDDVGRIGA